MGLVHAQQPAEAAPPQLTTAGRTYQLLVHLLQATVLLKANSHTIALHSSRTRVFY